MTEEQEEKKARKRRSAAEVAADYERKALRAKWRSAVDGVRLLGKAIDLLEEADAAWGELDPRPAFGQAIAEARTFKAEAEAMIPEGGF